jgi:hypothetical protein
MAIADTASAGFDNRSTMPISHPRTDVERRQQRRERVECFSSRHSTVSSRVAVQVIARVRALALRGPAS